MVDAQTFRQNKTGYGHSEYGSRIILSTGFVEPVVKAAEKSTQQN